MAALTNEYTSTGVSMQRGNHARADKNRESYSGGRGLKSFGFELAHALEGAQVDQDVNEGVAIGNRVAIAQLGAFDTEFDGLGIDPFGSSPLLVGLFVELAITVKLVADTSADAGGDGGDTAALGPLFVFDRARLAGLVREKQGTGIAASFVSDKGSTAEVGGLEWHRQASLA
jgi:hypothetical protein